MGELLFTLFIPYIYRETDLEKRKSFTCFLGHPVHLYNELLCQTWDIDNRIESVL